MTEEHATYDPTCEHCQIIDDAKAVLMEEEYWSGSSPKWAADPEDWKPELEKKEDE